MDIMPAKGHRGRRLGKSWAQLEGSSEIEKYKDALSSTAKKCQGRKKQNSITFNKRTAPVKAGTTND
jgi:hypothetical protein